MIEAFSRRITPFMPLPSPDLFSGGKTGGMPESFFSEREFFSSGRAALARAVALLNPDSSSKVFLPYFFCPQIREMLKKKYSVAYYEDLPSEREPRFSSLKARSGDIVVAVNFFGLRRREAWDKWKSENPGLILIEDHSHAPFSEWALSSSADFAFASLRKWAPLPDGAWLWGKGRRPSKIFYKGGDAGEFAFRFLEGAALEAFGIYDEKIYYGAENILYTLPKMTRISEYSLKILKNLNVEKIASLRVESMSAFLSALRLPESVCELHSGNVEPSGFFSYFPCFKFDSSSARDKVYARLRDEGEFACINWGVLGGEASENARRESSTSFQIPIDFRHSVSDALKLADLMNSLCGDFA